MPRPEHLPEVLQPPLETTIPQSGTCCTTTIECEASYWEVTPPGVNDVQEWASGRSKMGGIDRLLTPSCDSSTGAQHGAPGLRSPTTATPRTRGSIGANAPVCAQTIFKGGQTKGKTPGISSRCSSIVGKRIPDRVLNIEKTP